MSSQMNFATQSENCPKSRSHYDVYIIIVVFIFTSMNALTLIFADFESGVTVSEIIVFLQILRHPLDNWSYNTWS